MTEEEAERLAREESKQAFHWAMKKAKKKKAPAPVEEEPARLTWRDRERIKRDARLQVDSQMQFPSLGENRPMAHAPVQKTKAVKTKNMWGGLGDSDSDSDEVCTTSHLGLHFCLCHLLAVCFDCTRSSFKTNASMLNALGFSKPHLARLTPPHRTAPIPSWDRRSASGKID